MDSVNFNSVNNFNFITLNFNMNIINNPTTNTTSSPPPSATPPFSSTLSPPPSSISTHLAPPTSILQCAEGHPISLLPALCEIYQEKDGGVEYVMRTRLDEFDSWESFAEGIRFAASSFDNTAYTTTGANPDNCWPGHHARYYLGTEGHAVLDWRRLSWDQAQMLLRRAEFLRNHN